MATSTPNWSTFTKRIFIAKPAKEVYSAWVSAQKLEQWFLEKAKFHIPDERDRAYQEWFQEGDFYSWKWHNWDFEEQGTIIKANSKDEFAFSFGSGGIVRIKLIDKNQGTELVLTQESIPTDDKSKKEIYVGCSTGWTFWLTNLKAWLEHGITLHATGLAQEETKNLVNS